MPCEIHITDTTTDETRTYAEERSWLDGLTAAEYHWTDGNYGCDCNRALFFCRAVGEPDPDNPCGEERFKIRVVEDGREVYSEVGLPTGVEPVPPA